MLNPYLRKPGNNSHKLTEIMKLFSLLDDKGHCLNTHRHTHTQSAQK